MSEAIASADFSTCTNKRLARRLHELLESEGVGWPPEASHHAEDENAEYLVAVLERRRPERWPFPAPAYVVTLAPDDVFHYTRHETTGEAARKFWSIVHTLPVQWGVIWH